MRKKIYLPHLNYTVYVRPFKTPPDCISGAGAWFDPLDDDCCAIYLPAKVDPTTAAHELVHVLQHICDVRHINFRIEREHMAYVMQHLMGEVLGYSWTKKPKVSPK